MSLKITIPGNPATKKNSMKPIWVKGRFRLVQSDIYMAYEKDCLKWLLQWGNVCYTTPVHLCAQYWRADKRQVDLLNLLAATADILERAGIVENDNLIRCLDGSRIMGIDRENPRVEIELKEAP